MFRTFFERRERNKTVKQSTVSSQPTASEPVDSSVPVFRIFVDGKVVYEGKSGSVSVKSQSAYSMVTHSLASFGDAITVKIEGDVQGDVDAPMDVTCHNVKGNVRSGMSVACRDVQGNVDAGMSVNCGKVGGNAHAGMNVSMR